MASGEGRFCTETFDLQKRTRVEGLCKRCEQGDRFVQKGIFSESVAELILGNASVILERSRRIVRQNLAVLEKWVENEPHLSFVKPEAGSTALVYYDYDIDSRTFCTDMIKKSGALVTPGDCFEEPKSMRIGYAYSDNTDDLQKGLDAISAYMRTLE